MNKKTLYFCVLIFIFSNFAYLLPNYYDPWRTFYHDFLIFTVFLFLLCKVILCNENIQINRKIIFIFIISTIPIVQNLFGKVYFFGDAFISFIYIFSFGLSILIGLNLRRNFEFDKILKFICAVVIFSGLISSFIILKQWLLLTNGGIWIVDLPPNSRPFANFAQPNNCASFLLLSCLSVFYIFEKKIINHLTGILLISLFLFCLVLTQSRTVWVFSICFLIWWFWKYKSFSMRLSKYSISYYIAFLIVFIIAVPYFSNYLGVITTSDIVTRATTGYLRIPMWNQLLVAISHEPIWGYGWNQVSVAQLSIYLDSPTLEWTEHSHNILLDLMIWNGIPIGMLIIVFFVVWLWQLSRLTQSIEVFVSLAMIGVLVVHGMLEYPIEYAFFLLPLGLILGLISFEEKNNKIIYFPKRVGIAIFLSGMTMLVWVFVEYINIEKDIRLVQFELKNIGTLHAEHDSPNIILLTQLRERIRFLRTEPTVNMSIQQLDWMQKVTYRYGTELNLYRYAQALALNKQEKYAEHHLEILNGLYGKKNNLNSVYLENKSLVFKWKKK